MKIQCEDRNIRLRLSEHDYGQLLQNYQVCINLSYLPLQINVQQVNSEQDSILKNNQITVYLTDSQVKDLIAPSTRKDGITFCLSSQHEVDMLLTIQLDMMK